jgi:putative endonuclease
VDLGTRWLEHRIHIRQLADCSSSLLPATKAISQVSDGFFYVLMFTVYVLYSSHYAKIYVGYTSNLPQRILSHNELATKGYTIKFRPWKIIHTEVFEEKSASMKREKELKSARDRAWIWGLVG